MRIRIISLFVLAIMCNSARADVFNDIVREVLNNNLSLKSQRESSVADLESLKSENNLENPEVEFEHLWGSKVAGNRWSVSVSQSFDWPGTYGARSRVIKASSRAMEYLLLKERLDRELDIRTALIDVVNNVKGEKMLRHVLNSVDSILSKNKRGFELGEISILDINMLEVERLNVSRRLDEMKASFNSLVATLKNLNGGADVSDFLNRLGDSYPDDVILTLEEYEALAQRNDPEIAVAESLVESARRKTELSKYGNYPGFSLGYVHSYEDMNHFNGISVGVKLPFFNNRHKKKSAEAELRAAELNGLEKTASRKVSIQGERDEALMLKKIVDNYRSIVEKNDNILLLKKAYDGGQISVMEYLQQLNYFLEAQIGYNETLYRYHIVLAQLNRYNNPI